MDLYEIEYPEIEYVCSYKVALKTWSGLRNYELNTICQFLNHEFTHHNVQEDAVACSKVLLVALAAKGVSSIEELTSLIGIRHGKIHISGYNPCSIRSPKKGLGIKEIVTQNNTFDQEHEFYKNKLAFTGMLSAMTRKEVIQKVVDAGRSIGNGVTEDTEFFIMGIKDYSKFTDVKEGSKTKKVKHLISKGRQVQIIDEAELLRFLSTGSA